jgi:hypothetical protein
MDEEDGVEGDDAFRPLRRLHSYHTKRREIEEACSHQPATIKQVAVGNMKEKKGKT